LNYHNVDEIAANRKIVELNSCGATTARAVLDGHGGAVTDIEPFTPEASSR
jgi:pyridoxine 5'-phosphate synthase PdxJ